MHHKLHGGRDATTMLWIKTKSGSIFCICHKYKLKFTPIHLARRPCIPDNMDSSCSSSFSLSFRLFAYFPVWQTVCEITKPVVLPKLGNPGPTCCDRCERTRHIAQDR